MRDPALLDAVYTADSGARSSDVRTIQALLTQGLTVSGATHDVEVAVEILGDPTWITVRDSLPAYDLLDAAGAVVGRTAGRPAASRVLVLVRTAEGYRISGVQSA